MARKNPISQKDESEGKRLQKILRETSDDASQQDVTREGFDKKPRRRLGARIGKQLTSNLATKIAKNKDKPYQLTAMLPNLVTLLGLCAGVSALQFALLEKWEFALTSMVIAALLDSMDGALARMLNATSRFGAELDSLSDFATFGVCPALIMYFLSLSAYGSLGWLSVLWFIVCGALRLARFNTRSIEGTNPTWAKGFFTGTPITSSALLCVLPLVIHLGWPSQVISLHPGIVGIWMAVVGFLMISNLPTFSFKKVEIPQKFMIPLVLAIVVTTTALISHPWRTFSILTLIYICSFPLSYRAFEKLSKIFKQS